MATESFRRQPLDPGQNHYYAVMTPDGLFAIILVVQYQSGCAAIGWKTTETQAYQCVSSPQQAHAYLHDTFGGEEVQIREITPVRYRHFLRALRPMAAPSRAATVRIIKRGEGKLRKQPPPPPPAMPMVPTPPMPPPIEAPRKRGRPRRAPLPPPPPPFVPPPPEIVAPPPPPPSPPCPPPLMPVLDESGLHRTCIERFKGKKARRRR